MTLPPRASAAVRCLEAVGGRPLARVLVAGEARIGAWSWPDRTIVLTEKLVASLDDQELSAAVAHEMGHLELGVEPRPAALADAERAGAEVAADRRGAALLAASGLEPAAMPRMLRKVAALVGPTTAAGRAATARAERLEGGARSVSGAQAAGTTPRCWR